MTNYRLLNVASGRIFDDTGWLLNDPLDSNPSLIRTVYENKRLKVKKNSLDFFKYSDWLPISRILKNSASTVTYKSVELAKSLDLENLYISFSGYWPERGAKMTTCSFKETEAYSVCARLKIDSNRVMVVASAGNTARAFAKVCSDNKIPLLIVVPEDNIDALWFDSPINECVKLICSPSKSDYLDAIDLANKVCKSTNFFEEGGAKNVARRDGMATTVLSAATTIGRIPDYYFQAIGSGTGTIAAWEANLRLIEDGRLGTHKMVLIPSQNSPFTPMYDAWKAGSRDLLETDENESRERALQIGAKVLSNRRPPYSVPGGLFDALVDTGGDIEIADNGEMERACALFEACEGIDIHPAAGIALAGMIKSVNSGKVDREKNIMLNITGGGEKRFKAENKVYLLKPNMVIDCNLKTETILKKVESLF
ncbi:MAG: cysteate synthase [Bacteroidales bacterium]